LDPQVALPDPFAVEMHRKGFSQNFIPSSGKVLFNPNGRTLALSSEPVLIWDLESQSVITSLEGGHNTFVTDMEYSPDGLRLAALDDRGILHVWDEQTGKVQFQTDNTVFADDFAFSPDSALLAFATSDSLEIWDISLSSRVTEIKLNPDSGGVTCLAFSPDGSLLHTVLYFKNKQATETWEIATGNLQSHFELPYSLFWINGMRWPYFARDVGDLDKSWIEIWNLETGQVVQKQLITPHQAENIHFSPDGSLLVAVSVSSLYLWNTSTGQVLHLFPLIDGDAAISSDNRMLAIEQMGHVTLWDISQLIGK
jgi:WD40 repeat protein